ncbi:MAG: Stp1/IreP family PP2C-type Ser/Thr phosphatase [Deltaproteobacteria bacterium]|nr:Stp1/IreP family PP2C-type Ser/Thr phosphatase [Deltaproteobacteria bacterium]
MKVNAYGLSDVGKKREKNEDSFLLNEEIGLYLVADGMGGHLGGEYASRLAVTTIEEVLKKLREDPESTLTTEDSVDTADIGERFKYAISVASARIFEQAARDPNLRGMGTTTVGLLIQDGKAYIAHVGDSRAYLCHRSEIRQLTMDHSLVNEQLQAGFISVKDARNHKFKNIITRSVGFQESVDTDLQVRDLEPEDRYLLCTDGLTNLVDDEEIKKILSRRVIHLGKSSKGDPPKGDSPRGICEKLIDAANKKGGDDNITAIVITVEE